MSVKSYLEKLRNVIDTRALTPPYSFVSGNQSADLDSVISAISYSFFHNLKHGEFMIPLVNIPREDIKLRRDIVTLLNSQCISCDLLYFLEDFQKLSSGTEAANLVLVDHCNIQGVELTDNYKAGGLNVTAIIDHHADENVFQDAHPRIIETAGSCSSLVFNYWYDQFHQDFDLFAEHASIVELLMGPLVIDTSNMTQKVESSDTEAFAIYNAILKRVGAQSVLEPPSATLYETLKKAKKDLGDFCLDQVLRKDYKQFEFAKGDVVGFSSMGKSVSWILKTYKTETIKQNLHDMLESRGLSLVVITTSFTDKKNGQYTRELVCVYFGNKYDDLGSQLPLLDLEHTREFAETETLLSDGDLTIRAFNQRNTNASRKQVVPAVKKALEKEG